MNKISDCKKRNWANYTIKSLAFWVILAVLCGICVGYINPQFGVEAKPGIDWFIKILKWLVGPIIFLTIISGIVALESLKELGSLGFKAFIYFEIVSTFALAIGVIFGNVLGPGNGMNLNVKDLDEKSIEKYTHLDSDKVGNVWEILKNAIPSDPITPFLTGQTLQVLVMALSIAILISLFGGKYKQKILKPVEIAQNFFFKILTLLMWLSPIASFCAMSFLIGKFGLESLINMASLLGVMIISVISFIFIILGLIMSFFKVNIFKFMRFIQKEVLIVFATSSSESALAPLMRRLESAGLNKSVTGLVLPTGYSFNLDCTNIYLSLCVIFLSQAFNIPLTIEQELLIIFILMITSKGAVGVTGSGFIVLAGTLASIGGVIPVVTVTILLGVDKFMSEIRAVGNLCGNAVAAVVVGIWDKKIDIKKFKYSLDNPDKVKSIIGS